MNQPAAGDSPPAPQVHNKTPDYSLSEVTSAAAALAAIAPHLKEAALRLATYFAAMATPPHYSIRASMSELSRGTGLARSALNRAIKELCDEKRGYVTPRKGSTTTASAYLVNFLRTIRGSSFGEPPRKEPPPQNQVLFEHQASSFPEPPYAENKGVPSYGAAVEISSASLQLIDRVLSARPNDFDPDTMATFRRWLHGYMAKLGRDDGNQPISNPHPPKDDLVAQFLAIAEPRRLGTMLDSLMCDRQTCYSYGWFVTVALQRIHGLHFQEQKKARAALQAVKRGQRQAAIDAGEAADPQFPIDLMEQIAKAAGDKKLR